MEYYLAILLVLPFFAAAAAFLARTLAPAITVVSAAALMVASVFAYLSTPLTFTYSAPFLNHGFIALDWILLLYFAYVGIKSESRKILLLSMLQMGMLGVVESFAVHGGADIVIDRLSLFMFLLINIVGSLILIYAVRYLRDETDDPGRRGLFLAILIAFVGVMNLLVSTDNLEWLFLFFELTTLASFWLIGFRQNDESRRNALTALWMNQIGGVALLGAVLVAKGLLGSVYLSEILSWGGAYLMLFAALFAFAALVKGAQMPFSGWLLGAMVAPTPVSAILHSSTMVKIAPYFILKISPVLAGTVLGTLLALIGALSFLVSAALALREDNFKKILAYSTISLLGLMILTAALATPLSILACTLLIAFHGISKALLFLCAGILEKRYHTKSIESVRGLINQAPVLTSLVILGFFSVALPPFGVFFAKWIVYEGSGGFSGMISVVLLMFIAVGSVALTLLYFKTIGRFVARDETPRGGEEFTYLFSPALLGIVLIVIALFVGPVIGGFFREVASAVAATFVPISGEWSGITLPFGRIEWWHLLMAFGLLAVAPALASSIRLRGVDRVKPYACGERIESDAYAFYFDPARRFERTANLFSALLFGALIVAGVLS